MQFVKRDKLDLDDVTIEGMLADGELEERFDKRFDDLKYRLTEKGAKEISDWLLESPVNRINYSIQIFNDKKLPTFQECVVFVAKFLKQVDEDVNLFEDVWNYRGALGFKISHKDDWLSINNELEKYE